MDIRQLRYFVAVADAGNIHQAARRLHVAQPALSRRIRELEEELGATLFERLPRGVRLTAEGGIFLQDSRQILAAVGRARERLEHAKKGEVGSLRLAFHGHVAEQPSFPRIIRAYRMAHPQVSLDLLPLSSQAQSAAISSDAIDVGFSYNARENSPELSSRSVEVDFFTLAVPRGHRLARAKKPIRLTDLRDEAFVFPSRDQHRVIHDRLMSACLRGGLTPQVLQEASNEHVIMGLVSTGMALSFTYSTARPSESVVLKPVVGFRVPLSLDLVWRPGDRSPVVMQFVEFAGSRWAQERKRRPSSSRGQVKPCAPAKDACSASFGA